MEQKNYASRGLLAILMLVVVLVGVSFVPPTTFGSVELRRTNILSQITSFDDGCADVVVECQSPAIDESEYEIDMNEVADKIQQQSAMIDSVEVAPTISYHWKLGNSASCDSIVAADRRKIEIPAPQGKVIPIEQFDSLQSVKLDSVWSKLYNGDRPVRIAFMGDSFVEGDILTSDLREALQHVYGGVGSGFAPMHSPLTGFRRTVKTTSKGWNSYNIMQRRSAPDVVEANFYVSGWVSRPSDGASVRYDGTTFRDSVACWRGVRLLFVSGEDSQIEVKVNSASTRNFDVEGDSSLREIVVEGDSITSVSMRVKSGSGNFLGYGAIMDGGAVGVDNYSIRSNNGQAMFWTNPSINAQANALIGYDLVVLQYGLNIMQSDIHNYNNYSIQVEKMISYVRQCFPTAAVIVMGVSERMVRGEGGFAAMNSVEDMTRYQRRAAERGGAAFWSTLDAMRAYGGMGEFVSRGWAGKDYTHINYGGGGAVARKFAEAINQKVAEWGEQQKIEEAKNQPLVLVPSVNTDSLILNFATPLPINSPDSL